MLKGDDNKERHPVTYWDLVWASKEAESEQEVLFVQKKEIEIQSAESTNREELKNY